MSCWCPYFNNHIEQMRVKVFSVVTIPNKRVVPMEMIEDLPNMANTEHAHVNVSFEV